jgi:hypothetical protein
MTKHEEGINLVGSAKLLLIGGGEQLTSKLGQEESLEDVKTSYLSLTVMVFLKLTCYSKESN